MSLDGMTAKQIRRMEKGWHCRICGTRYHDKKEAENCQRECRQMWMKKKGR